MNVEHWSTHLPSFAVLLSALLVLLRPHQVHGCVQQDLGVVSVFPKVDIHMYRTSIQGISCANINQMSTSLTYAVLGRLSRTLCIFTIKKSCQECST